LASRWGPIVGALSREWI